MVAKLNQCQIMLVGLLWWRKKKFLKKVENSASLKGGQIFDFQIFFKISKLPDFTFSFFNLVDNLILRNIITDTFALKSIFQGQSSRSLLAKTRKIPILAVFLVKLVIHQPCIIEGCMLGYNLFRSRAEKSLFTIMIEVPPIKMCGNHSKAR